MGISRIFGEFLRAGAGSSQHGLRRREIGLPDSSAALSVVRGTTSPWPDRATSFRTTSSVTSYRPSAAGSLCRRRAALTATPTPIPAGKSLRSGAAAATATWNGAAIAARSFTRPSQGRIAESATEAPSRCGRTSKGAHQTSERQRWRGLSSCTANVHVTAWVTKSHM